MTDTRRDPVPGRDPAADREPHEDRRDEAAREHGQGDQRVFHDAHRTGLYPYDVARLAELYADVYDAGRLAGQLSQMHAAFIRGVQVGSAQASRIAATVGDEGDA
jgi:hypothetical protein